AREAVRARSPDDVRAGRTSSNRRFPYAFSPHDERPNVWNRLKKSTILRGAAFLARIPCRMRIVRLTGGSENCRLSRLKVRDASVSRAEIDECLGFSMVGTVG